MARTVKLCKAQECTRKHHARGYCITHYKQFIVREQVSHRCVLDSCERITHRKDDLCRKHAKAKDKWGDPLFDDRTCLIRKMNSDGYILVNIGGSWILEHRHIMAHHLKRSLSENENVHHVNGFRDDNRLDNLELWASPQPSGQRVCDLVSWAVKILERHAPERLRSY